MLSISGEGVDFSFPGKDIYSTSRTPSLAERKDKNLTFINKDTRCLNGNDDWWTRKNGTSFAAPHCAAAAAIVLAYIHIKLGKDFRTRATRTDLMKRLMRKVANTKWDNQEGYGFPKFDDLTKDIIEKNLK